MGIFDDGPALEGACGSDFVNTCAKAKTQTQTKTKELPSARGDDLKIALWRDKSFIRTVVRTRQGATEEAMTMTDTKTKGGDDGDGDGEDEDEDEDEDKDEYEGEGEGEE